MKIFSSIVVFTVFISNSFSQVTNFPYAVDFETETQAGTSCGVSYTMLTPGWSNDLNDVSDWLADAGGTSSSTTGPSIDHNPGTVTGKYLYVESSGTCNPAITSILNTPVFNFSALTLPKFSMWYHMYGAATGSLTIESSIDGGTNWTALWSENGDQGNQWLNIDLNLSSYAGETSVQFRIVAVTGTSFTSDMAIDDILVYQPEPIDIRLDALNGFPLSDCNPGYVGLNVDVTNVGYQDRQIGDTLFFSYDDGITALVDTVELTAVLSAGSSYNHSFSQLIDYNMGGTYNATVFAYTNEETFLTDNSITDNFTNYSNTGTDVQVSCGSYAWIDGNTYTSTTNTPTTVLQNSNGCDSTVTLDLTILPVDATTDTQSACDTYDWIDGNTYTTSNNTATHTLTNVAGCDSIVTLDLTINNSNTGTDTQIACVSYTWIDGNTYTNSNTTATYVLTNQAGCDSTVTLDLTINPLPNTNVLQSGATLTADLFGADYQWLDCDDNYAVIGGETSQSFTPTVTGNYAVELTMAGCSDTSDCYTVDFTGLSDLDAEHLEIYPNPTNDGIVFINYDGQIDAIEVLDMAGRKVLTSVSIENNQIDISKLEMGNYMIHITTNEGVVMKEVTVVR